MTGRPANALDAAGADPLVKAHERLVHDASFQFSFTAAPPPQKPPEWLIWLFKILGRAGPFLSWVFWGLLIVGVLVIAVLLIREFVTYRRPTKAVKGEPVRLSEWRPDAARARVLLSDADRLAAEGRYSEAAHLLLFRSIADIEEKRPRLIAPAFTSRDIAVLNELPQAAQTAFGRIAHHVERHLFADRPLDVEAFRDCRAAYEAFAFPDQWRSAS